MTSFLRIAGAAAVVFSLGLIVQALPLVSATIQAPVGVDAVSRLCAKLVTEGELQAKLKALHLKIKIAVIAALFKGCADELLHVDTAVAIDVESKASLVACIVSIITLCVQVFVRLTVKFGLAICVDIDDALRVFLAALGVCVEGILALVAKALASVTIGLLGQANLKLCLAVLGL